MANMLKFRKGLFKNLPEVSASTVGTIYVTTDEQAMYVDVAADKRIRISDFIRVDTVKDITPPFSTSSLYYVEADNALLKYTGEGEGKGWKQVNGTDDLRASLKAVTDRVSAAEGKITTAEGKITTAEGKITALETAVGTAKTENAAATGLHADIEALKAAIGMNEEGEVEGLDGRVTAVEGRMTTAEDEIDALQNLTNSHSTKIQTLETASAQHVTKTEAEAFAKTADIEGTLAKVDTGDKTVSAAIEAAVAVEKGRAELAEKALDDSIKEVKKTADGAVQSTTFESWKIENTTAINNAKTAAIEAAEDYADGLIDAEITRADNKYATKLDLQATNNTVANHGASLTTLTGTAETAGSVNWAKAAADAAMAKANEKTTMAEVEAKDYATKDEAKGYADAKDTSIKAAADAAAAAQRAADAAQDDATTALNKIGDENSGLTKAVADNATAAANAQKAIDDYSDAHAGDYTNAQIDTAIKAVDDVVKQHSSTLEGLTGENGAVAKAQAAADKAQSDLNEYKEAHKDDMTNEQINAAIKVAKDAADAAQGDADANAKDILALQGAVDTLNGDANTAGSVAKAVADAKADLEDKIAADINAANSMTYIEGVAKAEDLPTTAAIGDTYVVSTAFGGYQPGDLLIATAKEGAVEDVDTGKLPSTGLEWTHVKTGYDASLEQTIITADGKIQLTSAIGANNGQVAFVADENSAAKVTVANNTVTIGMEWEDFE